MTFSSSEESRQDFQEEIGTPGRREVLLTSEILSMLYIEYGEEVINHRANWR